MRYASVQIPLVGVQSLLTSEHVWTAFGDLAILPSCVLNFVEETPLIHQVMAATGKDVPTPMQQPIPAASFAQTPYALQPGGPKTVNAPQTAQAGMLQVPGAQTIPPPYPGYASNAVGVAQPNTQMLQMQMGTAMPTTAVQGAWVPGAVVPQQPTAFLQPAQPAVAGSLSIFNNNPNYTLQYRASNNICKTWKGILEISARVAVMVRDTNLRLVHRCRCMRGRGGVCIILCVCERRSGTGKGKYIRKRKVCYFVIFHLICRLQQ